MTLIKEIKQYIKANSYLEIDEETENYLLYITREYGNVGEEVPGKQDIEHVQNIIYNLKDMFKDKIKTSIDIVDEWVYLEIKLKEEEK